MMIAFVGAGGKTTLLKKMAEDYRAQGRSVFVTTTTHMFIEEDTLLTDDPDVIIHTLRETGYAMAGIPEGKKIRALSRKTFETVCAFADIVLVEADGSKHLPVKFPGSGEPVVPEGVDEIIAVCGLNALGQKAKHVCHRLELVKDCLGIDDDTPITPEHIRTLVTKGYLIPLKEAHPNARIRVCPRHDGSPYQRAVAAMLENGQEVSSLRAEGSFPGSQR